MAIHLSFIDEEGSPLPEEGALWRLCDAGSSHDIRVHWSEHPEHNLPDADELEYELRVSTWFFLHTVRLGDGALRRVPEQHEPSAKGRKRSTAKSSSSPTDSSQKEPPSRAWEDRQSVTSGRLLTRYVDVVIKGRLDPPQRARLWLIPRASVWISVSMLIALLVGVALLMATALATLQLDVTASEAVTGLGGLMVLGLAWKLFMYIVPPLRGKRPPLLGLGYMFGRTALICALVAAGLLRFTHTHSTALFNATEATVELRLPDAAQPVPLAKQQRITFLGSPTRVKERKLSGSLGPDSDRFCIASHGAPRGPDDECKPPPKEERPEETSGWLARRLRPARLDVRCKTQHWEGLAEADADELFPPGSKLTLEQEVFEDGGLEARRLQLTGTCELAHTTPRLTATVSGSDWSVTYHEVTHPWRLQRLAQNESARLVVDSVPSQSTLWTPGPEGSEVNSVGIELEPSSAPTPALPIAHPVETKVLEFRVGNMAEAGAGQSALTCRRQGGNASSYFRLMPLSFGQSGPSWLVGLHASAGGRWESIWRDERPAGAPAIDPWICAVALGSSERPDQSELFGLESVKLELTASLRWAEQKLALRIPAEFVRNEIQLKSESGPIGTLGCEYQGRAEFFEVAPLWLTTRRLRDITRVDAKGEEGKHDPSGPRDWSSVWRAPLGVTDPDGLTPWVCRPVLEGDPECGLGCAGSSPRGGKLTAIAISGSGTERSGTITMEKSSLTLSEKPPNVCYFSRGFAKKKSKRCTAPCPKVAADRLRKLNEVHGLSCQIAHECPGEFQCTPS